MLKALSYAHRTAKYPLIYETLGETLRKRVEATPDKVFCHFVEQRITKTFEEFYTDVQKLSSGLAEIGLKHGDRVGAWSSNYYEWIVSQYSLALLGIIHVNVNPNFLEQELRYIVNKTQMAAIIAPNEPKYVTILDKIKLEKVVLFGKKSSGLSFWDMVKHGSGKLSTSRQLTPDEPINMQFTSGTTGYPKGATHSHFVINNNARLAGYELGWDRGEHRVCIPLPLYHVFGSCTGVVNAVNHGQTVVFPSSSYHAASNWDAIEQLRCTAMFGTPTMFVDLLAAGKSAECLTAGFMAGSFCPPTLCQQLIDLLGMRDLTIGYGCTEMQFLTLTSLDDSAQERTCSVGHTMPHMQIAVVDEFGSPVARGQRGELVARGYSTMLGYWNDEQQTQQAIDAARWYHTGDIAVMHTDGTINIVGRSRDMIIRGGENIYPVELEHVLLTLPYVADAQVVGVADSRLGEQICAWIRVKPSFSNITSETIRNDCSQILAKHKVPYYIFIKDESEFPKTVSGKIQKYKMRQISETLIHSNKLQ